MTIAQHAPATIRVSSRSLLLGSLALNLFFVGIAVALAVRGPAPSTWDRDVFVRAERLAATLPPADADVLRAEMQANRDTIGNLQSKYYASREAIRDTLSREPFDPATIRQNMADTRAARQAYDQAIQGAFADAATKMTPAGRAALADWPPGRNHARGNP